MKGMSAFATFALTIAVLGLMIGLALRGNAQGFDSLSAASDGSQAFLPVVGVAKGESARVHVVNLSTDATSPAVRFTVLFVNDMGTPLKPAVPCDIRAGETCTVAITLDECGANDRSRCEFRAVVSTDPLPAPPSGTDAGVSAGGGPWFSNLEIVDRQGHALLVSNPVPVMVVPTLPNPIGTDGGLTF